MKIWIILWTRPEIIKLYSIIYYLQNQNAIGWFLIHSNQHYDSNMDKIFFDQLWLKEAKYNLHIGSGTHGWMTGKMIIEIEKILLNERPDRVFIQWDTNTVLAWWIAASKIGVQIGHIEAWLRSHDKSMPEEINRIVVDHLADGLFCPTQSQQEILMSEWIQNDKILTTGNTIVDAVSLAKQIIQKQWSKVQEYGVIPWKYILLTVHRPSNVDDPKILQSLIDACENISRKSNCKILRPIHPRTKNIIQKNNNISINTDVFMIIAPVWFIENIDFQMNAHLIMTDSWWIQEEWCILQKKILILRENTERPETINVGGAILVWNSIEKILNWYETITKKNINRYNPFWDWFAYQKIIDFIV